MATKAEMQRQIKELEGELLRLKQEHGLASSYELFLDGDGDQFLRRGEEGEIWSVGDVDYIVASEVPSLIEWLKMEEPEVGDE